MSATIVIVTRNRREDVLRAVASAVAQAYEQLEVLVYDDASSDGSAEAIRRQYPAVRVVRSERHEDVVVLRNRGFRDAAGEVVFSIDDDAYFTSVDTVSRTMSMFEANPSTACVALPYREPSAAEDCWIATYAAGERLRGYVGCAHALRRSVVLEAGGYREFFLHQGEERDLAIRLSARGYRILYGDSPPIVHTVSPRRDRQVLSYYGVRNTLLFDMLNVPWPYVPIRLAADAFNLLRYKLTLRSLGSRLGYVAGGLGACLKYARERAPVSRECYREFRRLPRHGPAPLCGAEVPAPCGVPASERGSGAGEIEMLCHA